MSIIRGIANFPSSVEKTCIGVGVFDGVHWGHRAIFEQVLVSACPEGLVTVALTFDKHPSEVLAPQRTPLYISSLEQRVELISQTGIQHVVVAEFSEELARIPREDFLHQILLEQLKAATVVVGANFRFGKDRQGDVRYLNKAGAAQGLGTTIVPSVIIDGAPVSSTRIRALLAQGEVRAAANMLGHSFVLRGEVVPGRQVGRTLGFPTANIDVPAKNVIPAPGVYAVRVELALRIYQGLCNIGNNPTFGGTQTTVEVHLLDFEGDLYDQVLDVEFVDRIRGEVCFEGPDQLIEQINRDKQAVEGCYGIREV